MTKLHAGLIHLGALILLLPFAAQKAVADSISTFLNSTNAVCSQSGTVVDQTATCTVIGSAGSLSMHGIAGYGNLAGSAQITNATAQADVVSVFQENISVAGVGTVTCPTSPGVVNCPTGQVETFPTGSQLNASVFFSLNGSWSESNASWFYMHPVTQVTVNGQGLLQNYTGAPGDEAFNQDCSNSGIFYTNPTGQVVRYVPCSTGTTSGAISAVLQSVPVTFTVGNSYTLGASFDLFLQCQGSCTGNFLDPTLSNIEITDPATGLPVQGLSVTGDTGTVYPVNQAEVIPEPPDAIYMLGVGLLLMAVALRRTVLGKAVGQPHVRSRMA